MKTRKVFAFVLLSFFVFSGAAFADGQQTQAADMGTQITVNTSDLPADILAKIQAKQKVAEVQNEVKSKLETAGEYAKFGHEIGVAVNETLVALTEQADKFSGTKVGQWAMILVTWKVMAKDALELANMLFGYVVGSAILFGGSLLILWSYRKHCIPQQVLASKAEDGTKTYVTYVPHEKHQENEWDTESWAVFHFVILILTIITGLTVVFG
ncbi:MAG: hypothetical protein HYT94_05115 [Parcubacteria group bacterium]|nr:hypothetical protein [Parcubacteria group bacterium]